ncbi:MAG: DUF2330 domain-containing protein [Opitutaceae bacterium]|jgi:hypothetical protein
MKMVKSNGVFTLTLWATLLVLLVSGTTTVRADGKVFAPVLVPQQVEMPDQRALLAWKDDVETLVIESAFVGKGTDFAWVVPLPSKPEVFPATSGTLPSAVALMQPAVAKPMANAWELAAGFGGIGLIALAFGWGMVGKVTRVILLLGVMAIPAITLGAIAQSETVAWLAFIGIACPCLWASRHWFQKEVTMGGVLVQLLLIGVFSGMMMPAFSKVRSVAMGVQSVGGITVEQQRVGDYDVTLISGREGDGVVGWLKDHGFTLSDEARMVATEHATSGSWFVASRVRREFVESGRSVPAPLAFRFHTKQALYPMRLTGAGATRPLELELIVCGPGRAEVTGLKTRTAAPLAQGEPMVQKLRGSEMQPRDTRKITHPELTRWTQGTEVATWMRGTLSPAQMQADMPIHWTPSHEALGLFVQSTDDARAQAALLGALLCFTGAMILGLFFRKRPPARQWAGTVVLIALASAVTFLVRTPTIAVKSSHDGLNFYELRLMAQTTAMALIELPSTASDEVVQATFAEVLTNFPPSHGHPVKTGDAPGEAMLRKLPDGSLRVLFFDGYGQPHFFEGTDIQLTDNPSIKTDSDQAPLKSKK